MAYSEDLRFCQMLVDLKPYLSEAEESIQIIVEELKHGSMIHWCNIRRVLCHFYEYNLRMPLPPRDYLIKKSEKYKFCNYEHLDNFIFNILTLFDKHKCSDISVIADVLELFCITRLSYSLEEYDEDIRLIEICNQTSISIFEKTLVFPYKDVPSLVPMNSLSIAVPLSNSDFRIQNWVEMAAVNGDVAVLKAMISFGATLIVHREFTFHDFRVPSFFWSMYGTFSRTPVDMNNLAIVEAGFRDNIMHKMDNYPRKRLYLMCAALQSILYPMDRTKSVEYTQCARILMHSTPEPFFTSEEIRTLMSMVCSGIIPNDQVVLHFLEMHDALLPVIGEVSTPRTLKHLSRFQVREIMRTARSFPHGVKSLCVPQKIKDLICLKDILL